MIPSPISVQSWQSLLDYNSFHIEESSRFFCEVSDAEQVQEALNLAKSQNLEVLVLGGGSNILLTKPFNGITIKIANKGIEVLETNEDYVILRVAAGENWHSFVEHCLENNFFGLENLSLIPGSIGAAPMQNIGAYGVEVGSTIVSVQYFDREKERFEHISAENCRFGYRESIFKNTLKNRAIIWTVDFKLSRHAKPATGYGDIAALLANQGISSPDPIDVSRAVIEIRRSKLPDPAVIGNAGSFFKNPVISSTDFEILKKEWPEIPSYPTPDGSVKVPAGWLIEKAGWKGHRAGNCGVHERQALVLVNHGSAKGSDILNLAWEIIEDVRQKFGIQLHPEVNII
jgi:UDP-N-acetylmuramate dehydrogenase